MSHNKVKDFEEAAAAAERQFLGITDPEPTTPEAPVTPEVAEPVAPEPPPTLEPEAAPDPETPKALIDEEKYKGSVKAMNEAQREAAELRKQQAKFAEEKDALEAKLNEFIRQSKERPEPMDDLESDMPEVAQIAELKARKVRDELASQIEEINKWRRERDAEASTNRLWQAVLAKHPDFDDVVNSEAMVAWVYNEAPPIYRAIYDGHVPFSERDVIAVVDQFKQTLAPKPEATRPNKPSAADIAAPVRTSPVISLVQEEDPVTEAEINDFMHNVQRKSPAEVAAFNAKLDRQFGVKL